MEFSKDVLRHFLRKYSCSNPIRAKPVRMVRLVALFLLIGMLVSRADDSREYILLSGGPSLQEWEKFKAEPHDRWWGNFIRSARVRIQEIQAKLGPGVKITWLVHKPSYLRRASRQEKQDLIGNIVSVRDKYGVNLIWFDEGDEVSDYLNSGQQGMLDV